MTILTPNSSDILQTNDHANMEERYRKAGVVANDGETNSGVTLESAPPGASPLAGAVLVVGTVTLLLQPLRSPAPAPATATDSLICLHRQLTGAGCCCCARPPRKTPPPTTSSSPLLAPLISVQARHGTGVMEDTIKAALTELLQRRVPEATEK